MREKIIEVLITYIGGTMTYHIANIIGYRGNAAPVRRELQKMEREGLVERAPSYPYMRQIRWRLKPDTQAAKGKGQ